MKMERNPSSFLKLFDDYDQYNEQYQNNKLIKLRGGGCGVSKVHKEIQSHQSIAENQMQSEFFPQNFHQTLNDCLRLIIDEALLLGGTTKRNEVIKKIQWFIHNREHLNYFCLDEKEGSNIYELVKQNFDILLTVGFYVIKFYKFVMNYQEQYMPSNLEDQKDFLKSKKFDTQLEIEQTNVWKTGLEFEIKIIKIMIMNSQTNSTEGKNLLLNTLKEAAKSILSLSLSEDLLPSIIEGAEYLLKKGIEKLLYPKETYQTYYLIQLMKWSIIRQLKSKYSVYKQIQQLKDIFQQYIFVSDNWILHFSWIQMITDIIAYRPIIDLSIMVKKVPNFSSSIWNQLIENSLIQCVSYNKNQAIMYLFQNQEKQLYNCSFNNILEFYSKKKLLLFSQFLLKGDFTQNINHWDYYKQFTFNSQKQNKQEDYEIILESYEQEILQILINNLISEKDQIISIHQEIIQSFINYFKDPTYLSLQLLQDDQQGLQKQFLEIYKKLIILTNHIQELSKFEAVKLNLLTPYLNKFQNQGNLLTLGDLKKKIDDFVKIENVKFFDQLLDYFLIAVEFSSTNYDFSLFLETKNQIELEQIKKLFEVENFDKIFLLFEAQFDQFTLNLNSYKEKFSNFVQKEKDIKQLTIQVEDGNILNIIDFNCNGDWIKLIYKKIQNKNFLNKLELFNSELQTLKNAHQHLIDCKFSITILQLLKQFFKLQSSDLKITHQHIQNYQNKTEQSNQFGDESLQQFIKEILIQQIKILDSLLKSNQLLFDESNLKDGCKNLVAQIQYDFAILKEESKKLNNKQLSHDISKFFVESQYTIVQVLNKPEEIDNLNKLLILYNAKLKCKQQIKQLKQRKFNYFKSYEKLLCLELDFIHQQEFTWNQSLNQQEKINQDQTKQQEKMNENQQQNEEQVIQELNIRRNNYFSEKMKSQIKLIIYNLFDEVQKQNDKPVNLKLTDFLSFFQTLFNCQQAKGGKIDKIKDSIWQDIKNAYQDTKEKLFNMIDLKPDYRVREGLVYNLIRLQYSNQEQQINSFSCKYIQYMWVFEKDQRVRNLLKNKELIEIQKQMFSQDIDNFSSSIKVELKQRMQKLENLQQQIKLEGNSQKREQLQVILKQTYDQLDESLENLTEMSETMDISLVFLKDISKDVKQIKSQIDNLQESMNQVGDDIRKLRGKRYDELLEIRKQKILFQQKLSEIDSVYVQLNTIEYDPITGQKVLHDGKETTYLIKEQWDDSEGEVNEFIWEDEIKKKKQNSKGKKDVLLLSGNAGSGKSKAARKIEEFIWKQKENQSKWIPIFVSLPTLKNPKYNLFEQALESENYQFDHYQIREFKEAIQNKKEFIILILDSYDEMKSDCIQQNLLMTNKLFQDLKTDQIGQQVKVIITTRKEILNTVGYQTWFYGESLLSLKEVQIQNFNEKQQQEYLDLYVELSIKRKIKEIYEFVKQISGLNFDLEEFINIWNLVSQQVKNWIKKSEKKKNDQIFQNKEEEFIIAKIKTHKTLENLNDEQKTGLRKELLSLWSANKFKTSIESVQIQDLLTTPFMLEIIVQVLPNMTKTQSESTVMKETFIKNYLKLKNEVRLFQKARQKYEEENQYFIQLEQKGKVNQEDEQQNENQIDEEYQQKIEKVKLDELIDNLDRQNFFQNYSIVSKLQYEEDNINFDGITVKLNFEDIDFVLIALKMKKFTVFEFYDSFINFYHEQQIQKQRELGKVSNYESFRFDIYQFSSSLAIDMTLRELSQIGYKPQGKLDLQSNYKIEQVIDDWQNKYFDIDNEYKKLIRSCILLNAKGSTFSFTHKSIQEFYVAKYIFDLLISLDYYDSTICENKVGQEQNQNKDQLEINQNKESYEKNSNKIAQEMNKKLLEKSVFNKTNFNISTDNFRNVINFIREKLINNELMSQQLIEIVKLSNQQIYCRSASNSIYLLRQMNIYLGSQFFNNIELVNTNISGLSFFDCNLQGSKLQNVDISSCNLNLANLSNSVWSNIICKEKPFLKHSSGHNTKILDVYFSPDGQYIASLGDEMENNIKLWNAQTFQLFKDLEGHKGKVNSLSFSQESSILLSGGQDGTIRQWNIQNSQIKIQSEIIYQIQSEIIYQIQTAILKVQISKDSRKLYLLDDKDNFLIFNLSKDKLIINENLIFEFDQTAIRNLSLVTINPSLKSFAINPKEPQVALKCNQYAILINYETNNKLISPELESHITQQMIFSQNGKYFAIAFKKQANVWDISENKLKQLRIFNFSNFILSTIIFDKSNLYLILSTNNFVLRREIVQQNIKIQDQQEKCFEVQISPNGKFTAIIYEKKISIIEVETMSINFRTFNFQPSFIIFSKDSSQLSFILNDEKIKKSFQIIDVNKLTTIYELVWNNFQKNLIISKNFVKLLIQFQVEPNNFGSLLIDINKRNQVLENRNFNINIEKFCFMANSWIIAYITSESNLIIIYDLDKNLQIQEPLDNQTKEVQIFQFSPKVNQLAVVYKEEVLIWNLDQNPFKIQKIINLKDQIILQLNYSPDGSQIGLLLKDLFQIYNFNSNTLINLEQKNTISQVVFSTDNEFIGFNINYEIHEINILSKNQNHEKKLNKKRYNLSNQIIQLMFTKDQKFIITASFREIILWDLSTNEFKDIKVSYLENAKLITFSHNCDLIALNTNYIVELWKYKEGTINYLGSQLYEHSIKQLGFVGDDQHILLLQENNDLILCNINNFQHNYIKEAIYDCGALSSNNQIALANKNEINIFYDGFQKNNSLLVKDTKYLEFFEDKENLMLIFKQDKMCIWNHKDNYQIIEINFYQYISSKLNMKDEIIISQHQNLVEVWNIKDFTKIYLCGYHQDIHCFSVNQNGGMGLGIKDGQKMEIKNVFNVTFAFPINLNQKIKQLFMYQNEQFYIILTDSGQLFMYMIEKQQTLELKQNVQQITFFEEKNLFAMKIGRNIQLEEIQGDKLNILDSLDLNIDIDDCTLTFSNDGEELSINSKKFIYLFQISRGKKLIGKFLQDFNFSASFKQNLIPQQVQLIQKVIQKQGIFQKISNFCFNVE
ncbi:unnamed protein product [Paramecium sonneborni]|uniref:NACHT domain-containing protein n=1 Tax=Paramecium sonneborni TaxID=65129 RepID=A0A8S1PGB5_9CILI|nr:unnamed protein product [Paramecium sonneborni]